MIIDVHVSHLKWFWNYITFWSLSQCTKIIWIFSGKLMFGGNTEFCISYRKRWWAHRKVTSKCFEFVAWSLAKGRGRCAPIHNKWPTVILAVPGFVRWFTFLFEKFLCRCIIRGMNTYRDERTSNIHLKSFIFKGRVGVPYDFSERQMLL